MEMNKYKIMIKLNFTWVTTLLACSISAFGSARVCAMSSRLFLLRAGLPKDQRGLGSVPTLRNANGAKFEFFSPSPGLLIIVDGISNDEGRLGKINPAESEPELKCFSSLLILVKLGFPSESKLSREFSMI